MTKEEAVVQLRSLYDHCKSMCTQDGSFPEWDSDVKALEMAIAALNGPSREQVEESQWA